jgi:hypothetical protein
VVNEVEAELLLPLILLMVNKLRGVEDGVEEFGVGELVVDEERQDEADDVGYLFYYLLVLDLFRAGHLVQQVGEGGAHGLVVQHVDDEAFVFQVDRLGELQELPDLILQDLGVVERVL